MKEIKIDYQKTRLKLFALWAFILFNLIFRDIHQMTLKSHLEMLLTGYFNGMKVTDVIMLAGAMIVNIPIGMTLISLLAKAQRSSILNIIAVALMPLILLTTPPSDMDDLFHLTVELLALFTILRTSIKWRKYILQIKTSLANEK
jgi:hypothetical protein